MFLTVLALALFKVTCGYDLGGVISGNRLGSVPLGVSLGDGQLDVEGVCAESGVACENCTHAVTCIALPIGWLKVPLESCGKDRICNARLGGCVKEATPECESTQYTHVCEQVGMFPDAFDCRKFHMCSPPVALPWGRPADHRLGYCPRHYGYDPHIAQCAVRLHKGQCATKPVPACRNVGQSGPLAASSNHYYICLSKGGKLFPQIFVCPHGFHFQGGFCVEKLLKTTIHDLPNSNNIDEKIEQPKEIRDKNAEEAKKSAESSTATTEAPKTTIKAVVIEKSTEFPPDTFLADKFDLSNYEMPNNDLVNNDDEYSLPSFESY